MNTTSNHPSSAGDAHNFLTHLQEKNCNKINNRGEEDNQNWNMNYIRDIKKDLKNPSQTLPELLQNADDVEGEESCDSVVIQLTESILRVWNNGRPMTEDEVRSLCGLGESTKRLADKDFIGHFGRGFKSVFNTAETVTVRSGYFDFSLDDNRVVVPHDISAPEVKLTGTEMVLPLKDNLDSTDMERIESQIRSIERLLPYLRRVSTITVNMLGEINTYTKETDSDTNDITIYCDGEFKESQKLFETKGVPNKKARQEIIKHRELDEPSDGDLATKTIISVRFDKNGDPKIDEDKSRLFNYLPTQEQPRLPFDVQADFLLASNRESLHDRKSKYNQWLLHKTGDAFKNLVEYYKKSPARDTHLRLIPTSNGFDEVREAVCESVRKMECIPIESKTANKYVTPDQVVDPSDRLRSTICDSSLSQLIEREISYIATDIDSEIINNLVDLGLLSEYNIEDAVKECRTAGTTTESLDRKELLKFVTAINEYNQKLLNSSDIMAKSKSRTFESTVAELELIPIKGQGRRAFDNIEEDPMIPSDNHREALELFSEQSPTLDLSLDISMANSDESSIISDNLIQESRQAYESLFEFGKFTTSKVIKRIVAPAFENVDEHENDILNDYLAFIFRNKDRWDAAETHLNESIHLKNRDGDYVNPEKTPVFYPDTYGGEYSREKLLECTDATFLSEEYLQLGDAPEHINEGRKSRCRKFFDRFNVRDRLEVHFEDKSERALYSEQELQDYFERKQLDAKIPDSLISKTRFEWMKQNPYAIKDSKPSRLFDDVLKAIDNGTAEYKTGVALAKMIDKYWEEYENKLNLRLNYIERDRNSRHKVDFKKIDANSTFAERIRNDAWFPTDDGSFAPPKSLFTKKAGIGDITVSECGYTPKQNCRETIGISKTLGWRKATSVLRQVSDTCTDRSPATIKGNVSQLLGIIHTEWSSALEERRREIVHELKDERFLYHENSSSFVKPDRVTLAKSGLGDYLVVIDEEYRPYEKMLAELGAVNEIGLDKHLDYLSHCNDVAEIDQVGVVWPKTIGYLDDLFIGDSEANNYIKQKLESEQCLLNCAHNLISLSDLKYYCYDEELLANLDDQKIKRETVGTRGIETPKKTWPEMWEKLGLQELSSRLKLSIVDDNTESDKDASTWASIVDDNTESDKDAYAGASSLERSLNQLLHVANSLVMSEDESNDCSTKLSEIATNYTVQNKGGVNVRYLECSEEYVTEPFTVQSFIDSQNKTIFIGKEVSSQYDFAERLADFLSKLLDGQEVSENLLTGSLGKNSTHLEEYLNDNGIQFKKFTKSDQDNDDHQNEEEETNGAADSGGTVQSNNTANVTGNDDSTEHSSNGGSKGGINDDSQSSSDDSGKHKPPSNGESEDLEESRTEDGGSTDQTENSSTDLDPISDVIGPNDDIDPKPDNGGGFNGGGGIGGGGGGTEDGGELANHIGDWGEDYTFILCIKTLRESLPGDSIKEKWSWEGAHPDSYKEFDNAESEPIGFECPVCNSYVQGVQFTGGELQRPVSIFYIGEYELGADIYIQGAAMRLTDSEKVEIRDTGAEAQTWIEVKSTMSSSQTEITLTPNEYQRAHHKGDAYLIVNIVNTGSNNVKIDRILPSLGQFERQDNVSVSGDLKIKF